MSVTSAEPFDCLDQWADPGCPFADDAWREPLELLAEGRMLIVGSAVERDGEAVILAGAAGLVAQRLLDLVDAGWSVPADGLTPVDMARGAPVVLRRRGRVLIPGRLASERQAGPERSYTPVRPGSDAVFVDVPRGPAEARLIGVAILDRDSLASSPPVQRLAGATRFALLTALPVFLRGEAMHLRLQRTSWLAQVPTVMLGKAAETAHMLGLWAEWSGADAAEHGVEEP